MHVDSISSNFVCCNYNTPNFKRLIKDKSVLPIINSMSESDKFEFQQIEERLSKTKFWDMKISSVGNRLNELKFHFIHKSGKHGVITDGIYPYDQKGKTIKFYSIFYGSENVTTNDVETLNFKSEERAKELYNNYKDNILYMYNRGYNLSPLERLKIKEVEFNMLEEAAENSTEKNKITHLNAKITHKSTTGNDLTYSSY